MLLVGKITRETTRNLQVLGSKAEDFADGRLMVLALRDWFDKDKHKERISSMSELDASLYMKFPTRAARAVEYALEKIEEMEME